ncbi:calcium-binding EF-hand family protein [Tanacetum coccineum]
MGVILIDGATVRSFVNDDVHFKTSVDEQFVSLDTNKDGVLSKSEMRKAFETMRFLESDYGVDKATSPEELAAIFDSIFRSFDEDKNGTIDINEFRSEIKKIMLAIADGLGSSPIQMAVDDDDQSLLKKAADLEAARLAKSA